MRDRVRVVRVFSRLNVGGPSIHVILLTAGLDPGRFESRLVVGQESPSEGNMYALAARHGVEPVKIPSLAREISVSRDLRAVASLWRLLRSFKPHIVHTHTSKAGLCGRVAARLARVPIVVHTFHGHVFRGYFGPAKTEVLIRMERFLSRWSDAVVTVSPGLKSELVRLGVAPAPKVHVVELGLDLGPFLSIQSRAGSFRSELGVDPSHFLVGIVGRLVPVKDHPTFLQAARIVADARDDVRFAIIGDGELRSALRSRAEELGLSGLVSFAGWRSGMAPVYGDLDCVISSSTNEGTPVCIVEASAAARPVVATAVGGVPDMVADGVDGVLVPARDPSALARGILKIAGDAALARAMGCSAREKARARYSHTRLARDVADLYERLLTAKGLGAGRAAAAHPRHIRQTMR